MIHKSLLYKMRIGAGSAGFALALGGAKYAMAEDIKTPATTNCPPIVAQINVALTKEQLETFHKTIPLLGEKEFADREKAYKTILEMGKGAIEPLKEALKTADDAEVKDRLSKLIKDLSPKAANVVPIRRIDNCPGCGKG